MNKRLRESHIFERQPNEHYVEPLELDRAIIQKLENEFLLSGRRPPSQAKILDPSCGFGRIPRVASQLGYKATGVDLFPRWTNTPDGAALPSSAFIKGNGISFMQNSMRVGATHYDAIVCNPPFPDAKDFITVAREAAPLCAFILPATFICGDKNAKWLRSSGLTAFMPICPRPSMPPGEYLLQGNKPGGGRKDYALYVWRRDVQLSEPFVDYIFWKEQKL